MVGLVRTSNQFKGWGHALAFDGEIKGWVTPKSGPRTPNPIAMGAMLCYPGVHILYTPLHCTAPHRGAYSTYTPALCTIQGRIFYIHPCTAAPHGTCLKKEERERKNVWLDLTAVKLAQEVGFVLPASALAREGKCLLTQFTVPPKGRGNPH